MKWLAPGAAGLALLTSLGASAAPGDGGAAGRTHQVTIEGVQFHPGTLTVRRDDRIVWTNEDPFPHTVTADAKAKATAKAGADARVFDSHSLAPQASWTYVASRRGEYPYACSLHPTMKGKIIVQ